MPESSAVTPQRTNFQFAAERTAARQQHIADAPATLRETIAAGWKDFAQMQKDPDLTMLRDLPEFQTLLKPK